MQFWLKAKLGPSYNKYKKQHEHASLNNSNLYKQNLYLFTVSCSGTGRAYKISACFWFRTPLLDVYVFQKKKKYHNDADHMAYTARVLLGVSVNGVVGFGALFLSTLI